MTAERAATPRATEPDRPPQHAVAAALGVAGSALAGVSETPLWSIADAQLLTLVDDAHALVAQAEALALRVLAEVDSRQLPAQAGAPSTKAWLRRRRQLSPGRAKRDVDVARALDGRLPATATALSAGVLSAEHAAAIVDVLSRAPRSAGAAYKADAEALLLENAGLYDPIELRQLGIHIWAVLDPDSADAEEGRRLEAQEARAFARRRLSMPTDGDGGVFLYGHLDAEGGVMVRTALDPLASPLPATAEGPDRRSATQRYAEALVELCRRALRSADLPDNGGEPPQLVITVPADSIAETAGSSGSAATPPRIARLDDGGLLSATAARRIGCDATLSAALLSETGVPLDMGRRRRLFTAALRRALVLRDGGCAFPGCDRPPRWCDGHHIKSWADGGSTSLANGVLLCGYHHRLIHACVWRVSMADDGHPEFHPPPWIGAGRTPLRNPCHRRPGDPGWLRRDRAGPGGGSPSPGAGPAP